MTDDSPPVPHPTSPAGEETGTASASRPVQPARARSRRRRWILWVSFALLMLASLGFFVPWEYAYVPAESAVLNPTPASTDQAFDVWGRRVSRSEAEELLRTA